MVDIQGNEKRAAVKVTGMPGKHVPPGVLGTLNEIVEAVSLVFGFLLFWWWRGREREGVLNEVEEEWEGIGGIRKGADVVVYRYRRRMAG